LRMKKLPIGLQDFQELIQGGYVYVDKTELIHRMVELKYYFLARPRRFGKSLLVSTLSYLFAARRDLFRGLWIEDRIDWPRHPVLHFDFASANFKEIGLRNTLFKRLDQMATQYEIILEDPSLIDRFQELIIKLAAKEGKVVILIDEYDRPITEYLEHPAQASENRDLIRDFFSVVKPNDGHIRFLFMTGVSKFSKVSMFSGFNNLEDITYQPIYNNLAGYTQAELETYFVEHLTALAQSTGLGLPALLAKIKYWYNGYNWKGPETVYNPFSLLRLLNSQGDFANYWFETGAPNFLVKLMRKEGVYRFENNLVGDPNRLDNLSLENPNSPALLLQTGYATLAQQADGRFALVYPNQEVREAFSVYLLAEYAQRSNTEVAPLVWQLADAFATGDMAQMVLVLNSAFANIPHQIFEEKSERYYHAIIYLVFLLLGFEVQAEVSTSQGQIDVVVQTASTVYVLEFKVGESARVALSQIKERKYYEKYLPLGKKIVLLGLACQAKGIQSWEAEALEQDHQG
jgi:Predicted AAA-ATPase/PD-(D/E)XK nuclease superfamily